MDKEEKEFHIELARIGTRTGGRITTTLALFATGAGLLFTSGGELYSEHPNASLVIGTISASFILIVSGMVLTKWSVSKSNEDIEKLRNNPTTKTEKVQNENISKGVVPNYTGNKYFKTRPRLAWHPPDKQFKN